MRRTRRASHLNGHTSILNDQRTVVLNTAVDPVCESLEQRVLLSFTNARVNDPQDDPTGFADNTQSETATLVWRDSPTEQPNVLVAFNDLLLAFAGDPSHGTGFAKSTDGGKTFDDKGAFPDTTDPKDFLDQDYADPMLARRDDTEDIYYSAITWGRSSSDRPVMVLRSDDDGETFDDSTRQLVFEGHKADKDWLVVDNYAGTGAGNAYLAASDFPTDQILFARLKHDETDWVEMTNFPAGDVQVHGVNMVVSPDRSVHVFYLDKSSGGV